MSLLALLGCVPSVPGTTIEVAAASLASLDIWSFTWVSGTARGAGELLVTDTDGRAWALPIEISGFQLGLLGQISVAPGAPINETTLDVSGADAPLFASDLLDP